MMKSSTTDRCASNADIAVGLMIIPKNTSVIYKNLIANTLRGKNQADTRIVISAPTAAETAGIAMSLYIIPNNCL